MMRKGLFIMAYNHSKKFYDKAYAKYSAALKGTVGAIKLNKSAFKSAYDALKMEGDKNPARTLVYNSKYGTAYSTALAEKRMAASMGVKVKLEDLKKMTTQDFAAMYHSELRKTYDDLKARGISGKDASLLVSQMWFGSN